MGEIKCNKIKLSLREIVDILYGHEITKKTADNQLIMLEPDFDIEKAGDG